MAEQSHAPFISPRLDRPDRARGRQDGLILMALGCLVFLLLGTVLVLTAPWDSDFEAYRNSARCLIHDRDPYNPEEALNVFQSERIEKRALDPAAREMVTLFSYPPPIFAFSVPMALLPYKVGELLFTMMRAGSLLVAAFLMWDIGSEWWPEGSGLLLGFLLGNSVFALKVGNVATLATSLCVIAAWCFLKQRLLLLGAFCMAASMALKPHDSSFVWLFFFLAGATHRRQAIQALLIFSAIALPPVLWTYHVAPHWPSELHENLKIYLEPGNLADPGPTAAIMNKPSFIVSLQTVAAFFRDDPRFYNTISYIVCGALLLVCAAITIRSKPSDSRLLLALASISALTLLPVYHRTGDAKLLMLSVPACAMLWREGGRLERAAFAITFVAFFVTADLPWIVAVAILNHYPGPNVGFAGQLRTATQIFPAPLSLLAVAAFYLWVYARRMAREGSSGPPSTTAAFERLATCPPIKTSLHRTGCNKSDGSF